MAPSADHLGIQGFERLHLVPLDSAVQVESAGLRQQARTAYRTILLVALAFLVLAPALYYLLIASDRYESVATFVVRSPQTTLPGNLTEIVQAPHVIRSTEEAHVVQAFLTSRDGIAVLARELRLAEVYSRAETDPLSVFPGPFSRTSDESLYKFARSMISISVDRKTGVSVLSAGAFRPADAKRIVEAMIRIAEQRINQLGARSRDDAIAAAQSRLERNRETAEAARTRLEQFRRSNGLVDPTLTSKTEKKKFARLALEAAELRVQTNALARSAPASPQLGVLVRRLAAVEAQSASETEKLAGDNATLGGQVGLYERLSFEADLAQKSVLIAEATLLLTQIEGSHQQYFLDIISRPSEPDYPVYPQRLLAIGLLVLLAMGSKSIIKAQALSQIFGRVTKSGVT